MSNLMNKMSNLMNNQLCMNIVKSGAFIGSSDLPYQLTSLVVQGAEDADNNEFRDFSLCQRYISFRVDNSLIMCNRLIRMNQLQLVSLTVCGYTYINPNDVTFSCGLLLRHC